MITALVRLILASASPRRAELLTAAGFEFDVAPANVDETPRPDEPPTEYVLRIAREKANRIAASRWSDVVLAADTVVVAADRMMGKPVDTEAAASMLRTLSGAEHEVHTAVSMRYRDKLADGVVTTRVRFRPLTEGEIAWYIATGEPFGKAGAYAIQGRAARFVDWIEGSWSNVVGLPISAVYELMKAIDASGEPD